MKVCGIIAEYNPFHNGHLYHIRKAAELSGADYIIVVMSGNFVQRGTPAIADKFLRTQAALACGAHLVLELPVCYATGSAEYFSAGAVSLLDKLGVVTHLCFGSECGDIAQLKKVAKILAEEPLEFREALRRHLKAGLSFPAARYAALSEQYPQLPDSLLSSPNNILGMEYIKALIHRNSSMEPITLPRKGAGYHDSTLETPYSSATAIRQALESDIPFDILSTQLPPAAADCYQQYFEAEPPVYTNDLSSMLYYKLLCEQQSGYASYLDVSEDLSDRIQKQLYKFTDFSGFCDLLKTKELTYSRISRCLLHILLNIRKNDVEKHVNNLDYVPYARLLGFQKEAGPLLTEIDRHIQIPFLSKLADAHKILEPAAMEMLQKDIMASDIYNSVRAAKTGKSMRNEYSTPIVIL